VNKSAVNIGEFLVVVGAEYRVVDVRITKFNLYNSKWDAITLDWPFFV
jgi:hypothetical protein